MFKVCVKCEISKNVSEFYKETKNESGYQSYCKVCSKNANNKNRNRLLASGPTRQIDHKECRSCHSIKPISQFGLKRGTIDGHLPYCKPCWVIYVRKAQKRQKLWYNYNDA
jgi:hypothetical protein